MSAKIAVLLSACVAVLGTWLQMRRALTNYRTERTADISHYDALRGAIEAVPSWRKVMRFRTSRRVRRTMTADERAALTRVEQDLYGWVAIFTGAVLSVLAALYSL